MTPGLHYDMPAAAYHADPAPEPSLSSSLARLLLRASPQAVWHAHPRLNPGHQPGHSDVFDLGTAAHLQLLEPGAGLLVVDAADWRGKEAQAQRASARERGLTPLLAHQYQQVQAMCDAATAYLGQSEIGLTWSTGTSEVTALWQEGPTWLRARFDRLSDDRRAIFDYKTTTDASPAGFSRQIWRMGYHLQDAFYRRAIRALDGHEPRFIFVAQSREAPFECSLHECSIELREYADVEIERAIKTWARCVDAGRWPSFGPHIHTVSAPAWIGAAFDSNLADDFIGGD